MRGALVGARLAVGQCVVVVGLLRVVEWAYFVHPEDHGLLVFVAMVAFAGSCWARSQSQQAHQQQHYVSMHDLQLLMLLYACLRAVWSHDLSFVPLLLCAAGGDTIDFSGRFKTTQCIVNNTEVPLELRRGGKFGAGDVRAADHIPSVGAPAFRRSLAGPRVTQKGNGYSYSHHRIQKQAARTQRKTQMYYGTDGDGVLSTSS